MKKFTVPKISGFVFLLVLLLSGFRASAAEAAPVLAVEPILDRIGYAVSHCAYSLQTRLTAELFTRYQCHPVARNIGLTLHQERSLKALHEQLEVMPKPRWIIGGSYQRGSAKGNGMRGIDIELVIVDAATGRLDREVYADKGGYYDAEFLAGEVARKLQLPPRPPQQIAPVDRSKEAWAVLPFQELQTLEAYDKRFSYHLSDFLAYQLQQSGRLGKLVDRSQMDQLLQEHQILSLNRVDAGSAAMLGRLLHADKIICGMVTSGTADDNARLDLLLIDCANGAVVNIQTGLFPELQLEEQLGKFAQALLDTPDSTVPANASVAINSELESRRLLHSMQTARTVQRDNTILADQVLSLGESFYLLNPESIPARNELFQTLIDNLFDRCVPADWRNIYREKSVPSQTPLLLSVEQGKALANFLLPMIDTLPARPHGPRSLETMRFYLLCNAARFDEAEQSIARGRAAGDRNFWNYQEGTLALLRGNPKEAGDIFLRSGYREYAVYAYYLAGEKFLAYQTAKKAPREYHPRHDESFMIYLELLETFESTAAAQAWFERYDAEDTRRGSPAKRTFLGKPTPYMTREFRRLRESAGKTVKFVEAAAFFRVFQGVPVYLQKLGNAPENAFKPAAELLRKKLGLEVVILPERKIPTAGIYHAGHRQFLAEKLLRAVRYAYGENYPGKGALMLCATQEALYLPHLRLNRSVYLHSLAEPGSLGVISGAYMQADTLDRAIALSAARLLLLHALDKEAECANFPCLFAPLHPQRIGELDFKLCESCAEKIGNADLQQTIRRFSAPEWDKGIDEADMADFELCRKEFALQNEKNN